MKLLNFISRKQESVEHKCITTISRQHLYLIHTLYTSMILVTENIPMYLHGLLAAELFCKLKQFTLINNLIEYITIFVGRMSHKCLPKYYGKGELIEHVNIRN